MSAADRGMTLVEMLVATTVTLVMMAAIGQVFAMFGRGVSGGRAALDLQARLRTVAWRLRQDLEGTTAPTLPPLDPSDGLGYLEIIEGPQSDADAAHNSSDLVADIDDVLLFTTRSTGSPFRGAFEGRTIESDVAEVAWFARPTVPATVPPTYTLYRKQMLVAGYVGAGDFNAIFPPATVPENRIPFVNFPGPRQWQAVYDRYDLSVSRRRASPARDFLVPNTLADLTKREHRFMHNRGLDSDGSPPQFPYAFASDPNAPNRHQQLSVSTTLEEMPLALEGLVFDRLSPRFGEDVVLTNVIAFDVRVFDPAAALAESISGRNVVTPEGPPLPFPPIPPNSPPTSVGANGAYVDLGNNFINVPGPAGVAPRFAGFGSPLSRLQGSMASSRCVYDTWSTHYEANGEDEDKVVGPDQGTNAVDDQIPARLGVPQVKADGVIDDVDEMETQAPYPVPLRGLEVRIRCYEPSSRQVRQVTIRHTFVPH